MVHLKRWLCLVLALACTAAAALPVYATDPMANSFAAFLIDAQTTDSPEVNLSVELYRKDASGAFQKDDEVRYRCNINRVAGDANFFIQPNINGVWVEVDYLTDLDGDGVYEMLDGQDSNLCDVMSPDGQLTPWQGQTYPLTKGQTYILSPETLSARGQAVLQERNTPGSSQALPGAGGKLPSAESVLYFISLHYTSSLDQEEYVLSYYLRLFDRVIVPSDVSPSAWYYDAVEYALEQGFFSGTGADSFSPNGTVTRAQLAQILWRLGGAPAAENPGFSDVSTSAWYYQAVAWCAQEGLMSGSGTSFLPDSPLTREQLALVLRQYAQYSGLDVSAVQDLSKFTDGQSASPWARDGLGWAVSAGLLSGYSDGSLRPNNGISRAELAAVLRSFCTNMLQP
jgi:hypothetical protein